jgi:hypothetical protein
MGGFIFRIGVRLKDWGEQWECGWLIRLGLNIREAVFQHGKTK